MIGHYLLVAFRNFRRTPVATAINVLALALGLTCFVIAYAVVQYWGHAEDTFSKADRTYAVKIHMRARNASFDTGEVPGTNMLFAKYLKLDFPEFETIARVDPVGQFPVTTGERKGEFYVAYADPDFLDIFNLPFLKGDPKTALSKPDGAILTDAMARQLFGTIDVIGRTLHYGDFDLTVTGVIGEIPQPSHMGRTSIAALRFDVLMPWAVIQKIIDNTTPKADPNAPKPPENWLGGYCCTTYVVLPKGSTETPKSLEPRFDAFVKRRVPAPELSVADLKVGLMPIKDLMAARLNTTVFAGANIGLSVTTLLLVFGGLVLGVACINYANLATAQAMRRSKEVGLRKTIGAGRFQIMAQYFLEAGLLTVVSLAVALVIGEAARPIIKASTDIDLGLVLFSGLGFWLFTLAVIAGVTILAGAYPALVLSRVRPMQVLRTATARSGSRLMPTILVGAQFAAASFLLIAVIVMSQQTNDLRRTGLGTQTDPLLVVTNVWQISKVHNETLEDEFKRLPEVKAVTTTGQPPFSAGVSIAAFRRSRDEAGASYSAFQNAVGYDFFSTMNTHVIAGRAFDRSRGEDKPVSSILKLDSNVPVNIMIDQAYAEQIGFKKPENAIGKIIYMPMRQMTGRPDQPARIIGVVENRPLHFIGMGTTGNVYFLGNDFQKIIVRISGKDVPGGVKALRAVWDRLAPTQPFQYDFVDQLFAQGYAMFGTVSDTFVGLALFAFVISTIGLFGMASHVATRRRQEIGVRKTIGASTRTIVLMLLKDFSKPVVVANIIAWPLAYFAAEAYLNVFIHRIPLSPVPFALSLAITMLIAWVAVGGQTFRAARVKPANVLRYE